jgi:glycosyltransferase involved in cell wall biosynthesis
MKLTILIACFNERPTILKAIQEAKGINLEKEIIIVDNCSTDGTREILGELKNDPALKIIFHSRNMGGGYSTREAIGLARGDYFYSPGADLEYKMADIYPLIEKLEREGLDAVVGSRLLARRAASTLYLLKERPYWLGTIIATSLINILFGKSFTDIIGTNLVKTSVLRALRCQASSEAYTFELIGKLCKYGYKMGEMPISYKPRTRKEGKTIRAIDIFPALLAILKVKFFELKEGERDER